MRRFCTMMLASIMLALSWTATAQKLPNDRQQDGLQGPVRSVEEGTITTKARQMIITTKITYNPKPGSIKIDNQKFNGQLYTKDTIYDTSYVDQHDTSSYYCKTEYNEDGYIKSQELIENGYHTYTEATFQKGQKIEMRRFCKETGITKQWHYYYSKNGEELRLEQCIVTQYKNNETGIVLEKIEYSYYEETNQAIETHISPKGDIMRTITYEDGVNKASYVIEESYGDTIVDYKYDEKGRISERIIQNTEYDVLRTDKYEYSSTGYRLTSESKNAPKTSIEPITYEEEYDAATNWARQSANGRTRTRKIIYYR